MRKTSYFVAAVVTAFFMLTLLCGTALAAVPDTGGVGGPADEIIAHTMPEDTETGVLDEIAIVNENPVTDYPETPPRPFTPAGTGTVVNNATDGDGKEFYTITTPDEHVFYLVIDRQRSTENVYFLNAVTEAGLMALAEMPGKPAPPPLAQPPADIMPMPTPTPAPTPEDSGGNSGMIFFVIAVVLIGGGAGWYFKIYKPKQQKAGTEEDIDYPTGGDDQYGDTDDTDTDVDSLPWDEEDETPEDIAGDSEDE